MPLNLTARMDAARATQQQKNSDVIAVASAPVPTSSSGNWGDYGAFTWCGYDPRRDAEKSIGNPLENSLLFAALDWQITTFQQAPFAVRRYNADGAEEIAAGHPLTALIKRPMEGWSRSRFWRATLLSRFFGDAYWHKVRDGSGIVAELQWLHHRQVTPVADENGHLSHYDYRVKNRTIRIEAENMVHIRDGVDLENPLRGFSRYRALVRPISNDAEADDYENILLHNLGIPGAMFSPPNEQTTISPRDADKIAATYTARTTGRQRGKPMVFPAPVKIDFPVLRPADFGLGELHERVEARVSMVMKIPATVLQTLVGIKNSGTRANYEEAANIAWNWNIIPTQDEITEEVDAQLMPDLGDPAREWSVFDRSEVEALQEGRDDAHERNREDFDSGIIDRAEARGNIGQEVRAEDAGVWGAKRPAETPKGAPQPAK